MSTPLPTAPQPLFDRLHAEPAARPGAGVGLGAGLGRLDAPGLQASLARELGQLLNTRSRLGLHAYVAAAETRALSLLDYGLPDYSGLSARSEDDCRLLQQAVAHCLARFEPRLSHTQVQVMPMPGQPLRLRVLIDAAVTLGQALRRVQFDLAADAHAVASTGAP